MRDITHPEESAKLLKWRRLYDEAKSKYSDKLNQIEENEKGYNGDRHVNRNPNKGGGKSNKLSVNVWNINYELIESQVNSAIPRPKVRAIHAEDVEKAKILEQFLINEADLLNLREKNDVQERTTPIQGASFFGLEWDSSKGYHCCVGDLEVSIVHPRQIIPQPGMTELQNMDYYFIRTPMSKKNVKRRWGKDVKTEDETDKEIRIEGETEDLVTVITAYYKNEDSKIGLFRWCGDVELEDLEDYEARHIKVCKKCGRVKDAEECPDCGSKSFVDSVEENEKITLYDTSVDAFGNQVEIQTEIEIPRYRPSIFPLVERRNVTKDREFLGSSDIEVIADQQDTIKKLGSNTNEKLIGSGSIFTKPKNLQIKTNEEQFKIVELENPQQMSMIGVHTIQADVSKDIAWAEQCYQHAKSALGITDAFQGKYDASARSGSAKQYSINQAAGRLESKKTMKNFAYANLYNMMFKYMLAYADQPMPVNGVDADGNQTFTHFDKRDFLKQDANGDWYWNDEFIITIDPTSDVYENRQALWEKYTMELQSGGFGQLGNPDTNLLYWQLQEASGFPNANKCVVHFEKQKAEQEEMMAQQMAAQEGVPNEMPVM